jgi:5-methylthioadenosine/S-adenosylhomocysteine deaminase
MFEEIRLAAFLAKGASGDPTALPAQTALLMATRLGAQAMHMGNITGSIEPGKRADLILVDTSQLHNSPRFTHDQNASYAQIVYAGKSTDVTDVMINGQWVMRGRKLLTLEEEELVRSAQEYARRIDTFLIQREQSVLSKLIAIGGAMEEESFEIQVKVRVTDTQPILEALERPEIAIERSRHYREYDTYFSFTDPEQGYLRYREDDFINEKGEVYNVRARLTLVGRPEFNYPQAVLLSRSRYYAPAIHSLRFYREYFRPSIEREVEKERLRFLVSYKDTEFFINIDDIQKPQLGKFLEVKSRTWSRKDANHKAALANELIEFLGASPAGTISSDYIEMVQSV